MKNTSKLLIPSKELKKPERVSNEYINKNVDI